MWLILEEGRKWGLRLFQLFIRSWRFSINIKFEPRDLWIGIYWNRDVWVDIAYERNIDLSIYICILPMIPIRVWFEGHDV